MLCFTTPRNVTLLRGFLFLHSFYGEFIKALGGVMSLIDFTKRDQFKWTEETEVTFQHMKKVMTSGLVLAFPNISQPFVMECDASS